MRDVMLAAAFLIFAIQAAAATPHGWSKLMSPADLSAVIAVAPELRVLHIGSGSEEGHIPGAVKAPLSSLRGDLENPGAIPPLDAIFEVMRDWGLAPNTPAVVVHDGSSAGDFGNAARVYWSLKSLGVKDVAILNGGFAAWAAAGLPVSVEPFAPARSDWEPVPNAAWRVSTKALAAMLASGAPMTLVDARPNSFFRGLDRHANATRPGTLPGAINLPFTEWFDGAAMLPPEQVRAKIAATGLSDAGRPVIAFCNTGIFAAIGWFAISEIAEVPETSLYAESLVEWSQAGGEMTNVPGRIAYYWRMFSSWIAGLLA